MSLYRLIYLTHSFKSTSHISCNLILNTPLKFRIHSKSTFLFSNSKLHCTNRTNGIRSLTTDAFLEYVFSRNSVEKICQNQVVYFLQEKLIEFHDYSGLPWWSVIICSTVVVRTVFILPIATHQQYVISRLERVNKEMNSSVKTEVTKKIMELEKTKNWDSKKLKSKYENEILKRRQELHVKYNCHPLKHLILVLIQVPVWTFLSAAYRNIATMLPVQDIVAYTAFLEMKASGFWWIKDLTVPDSTYTLPCIIFIINSMNIYFNRLSRIQKRSILSTILIAFFQGMCIMSFPIVASIPKCITLYWATSSLFALFQNLLFLSTRVRKFLRIPTTETMRPHPFQYIKNKIKSIIYFLKY
ncbi:hypothetical protein PGB90_004120 [Kerria lacca]